MKKAEDRVAAPRCPPKVIAAASVLLLASIVAVSADGGAGQVAVCADPGTRPFLLLHTTAGEITIELFEGAAPRGVARLAQLARGPIFNPELVDTSAGRTAGYFDGLSFTYTRPKLEIRLETRRPAELFELPVEIDAHALGLDRRLIANAGEAMDVAQMELHPAHRKLKADGSGADGRLREWLDRLYETNDASFLVGVSRMEINETLGHRYLEGLASRPATRGMVALQPASTQAASAGLTILLADHPQRTGTWMVVGRVVDGLALADEISERPLFGPPGWQDRSFTPRDPVVITTAELICRPQEAGATREGEDDAKP